MDFQQNISLKTYNTFGVEALAKYFIEVKSIEDLVEALKKYRQQKLIEPQLSILILGGGSNVLFTKDFDGLVIRVDLKGISEKSYGEEHVLVTAGAGENWHQFVMHCLHKNYGGLENLSLIPGNVGTSPMQNIGAYGTEMKDCFVECKVLNLDALEIEYFNKEQCEFGYRESFFKKEGKDKYVILEVSFSLTTVNHQLKTEYGAIKAELEKMNILHPSIQDISAAVISIRQSKLPDPELLGNAGSFFKNPTISDVEFQNLKKEFPTIPSFPTGTLVKIPAGWLIEQCGWKGKQEGNVACHHLQALVIVNKTGNARGKEIFDFSETIIVSVQQKFGIVLEREVNII